MAFTSHLNAVSDKWECMTDFEQFRELKICNTRFGAFFSPEERGTTPCQSLLNYP